MGNCNRGMESNSAEQIQYSETAYLKIKKKDDHGHIYGSDELSIQLSHPQRRDWVSLGASGQNLSLSGAILPGLDPRNEKCKDCQDAYTYVEGLDSVLIGLFDGHGREGLLCASYSASFMEDYFKTHQSAFSTNPVSSLEAMFISCDRSLRCPSSDIDASTSGSTCVVVLIQGTQIHTASVGDSRAVLASTCPQENSTVTFTDSLRKFEPSRELSAIALTIDQKPNHEEEYTRITKSGGIVKQLVDNRGNKIGPFRVWRKNGNTPGIAMSRSIGDSVATQVGVIATPIVQTFEIIPQADLFIVIGSDGLWDTMDNIEVVSFVERYRKKCRQSRSNNSVKYPVKTENTSVAHLLAEEARLRWTDICQEEDVMIDDISVVVLEMNSGPATCLSRPSVDRAPKNFNYVEDIEDCGLFYQKDRADLLRSSLIQRK